MWTFLMVVAAAVPSLVVADMINNVDEDDLAMVMSMRRMLEANATLNATFSAASTTTTTGTTTTTTTVTTSTTSAEEATNTTTNTTTTEEATNTASAVDELILEWFIDENCTTPYDNRMYGSRRTFRANECTNLNGGFSQKIEKCNCDKTHADVWRVSDCTGAPSDQGIWWQDKPSWQVYNGHATGTCTKDTNCNSNCKYYKRTCVPAQLCPTTTTTGTTTTTMTTTTTTTTIEEATTTTTNATDIEEATTTTTNTTDIEEATTTTTSTTTTEEVTNTEEATNTATPTTKAPTSTTTTDDLYRFAIVSGASCFKESTSILFAAASMFAAALLFQQ